MSRMRMLGCAAAFVLGACADPDLDSRGGSGSACDPDRVFSGDRPGSACAMSTTCQGFCCDCGEGGPSRIAAFCDDDGFCADLETTCTRVREPPSRVAVDGAFCSDAADDAVGIVEELP